MPITCKRFQKKTIGATSFLYKYCLCSVYSKNLYFPSSILHAHVNLNRHFLLWKIIFSYCEYVHENNRLSDPLGVSWIVHYVGINAYSTSLYHTHFSCWCLKDFITIWDMYHMATEFLFMSYLSYTFAFHN